MFHASVISEQSEVTPISHTLTIYEYVFTLRDASAVLAVNIAR